MQTSDSPPSSPESELQSLYLRLADAWGKAMEVGDSTTANSLHDKIQAIYQQIAQAQQEKALFDQAEGANDAVRFFIASHIKDQDKHRAEVLYSNLAHSSLPFIAVSARYILNDLRKK